MDLRPQTLPRKVRPVAVSLIGAPEEDRLGRTAIARRRPTPETGAGLSHLGIGARTTATAVDLACIMVWVGTADQPLPSHIAVGSILDPPSLHGL